MIDYERDIQIDETALDVEWLQQPHLMLRYSQHAVEMRKKLDLAKEKLDLVRAELDSEIRKDPEKFGIAKLTESAIQAAILQNPRYIEANRELIDAKYEADIARSAVEAFQQRKDALENLVRLFGMQYFAGPSVPRDLHEEWEAFKQKRNKDTNRKVAERLTRRR